MGKSIPWFAYLVIGILVSAFSKVIDSSTDSRGIMVFFYVGILFMLVGVGKLVIGQRTKKTASHAPVQSAVQNSQSSQRNVASDHPHSVIACRVCQTKNYASFNFCHSCGSRLRKI
jgi:sulfite exporter TauE/SafE